MRRIFVSATLFLALCAYPASAILDTNSNGLSDLWERAYNGGALFSSMNPLVDDDGDGWSNAQEAAAGTNPFDPNAPDGFVRPEIVHIPAVLGETPDAITVTWPTIAGKQYSLMVSPDLIEWLPLEEETFFGNGSLVEYSITLPENDKLFWRVAVTDVDSDDDGLTDAEAHTLGIASGFTDANANGVPDEWESNHAGSFAVYPPCLAARVAQNQSSQQSVYLRNDSGVAVNYSAALSGNTDPAYSFQDSVTGNVEYTWEDISSTGTLLAVVSNADDAFGVVDITGFTFPFYGQNFTQVFVSSNGLLTFGDGSWEYSNSALPNMSSPGNLIAALWDDLDTRTTGDIYFKQEADRLIVQYQDVARYGGADICTFQVVLFGDGRIQIHYQTVPTEEESCTVGIQNSSGTSGLEVVSNAPYLVNQMAIEIRPVSEFFTVAPLSGVVPAHATATLSGLFQSLKLTPGVYYANLAVSQDGAGISPQPVMARLEVKNTPSTVALVSPSDELVVMEGQLVNINATATDPDGITRVEFYDGGTKLGEVAFNTDGYFFYSNTLSVGIHLLIARVVDVYGALTDSLPVHLTVLADTDRDGMPDAWEIANGLNPEANDSLGDADSDGYTNLEEYQDSTNPQVPDNTTDNDQDGMWDRWELKYGLSITANDSGADLDHDGLTNLTEFQQHTFPNNADTDSDRLPDGWEVTYGLDPLDATGVNGADGGLDSDGVTNLDEYLNGTDPSLSDTDEDGTSDSDEINQGSDPTDTSDEGNPPDDPVKDVTFKVGGDYASWRMEIQGEGPKDHRKLLVISPKDNVWETKSHKLQCNNKYKVTLHHTGSKPDESETWYCWEAKVEDKPTEQTFEDYSPDRISGVAELFTISDGSWLVDNRSGLFTAHNHRHSGSGGGGNAAASLESFLLPVEVVEVSPKTKDEEGNDIAGSEKPSTGKPLTPFVELNPVADKIAHRELKVKIGEALQGKTVTWTLESVPGATPATIRGAWTNSTTHPNRFEASATYGANGFTSLSQASSKTTVANDGFTAIRVNVPPIGFNQVRIKIQVEGTTASIDLIDMEVPGVVIIDPGHGWQDSGAVGRTDSSILEKDLALEYSLSLKQKVIGKFATEKHGLKIVMTRKTTGEYMENVARANLARDKGADVFLSIHFNSAESTTARGTEYVTRSTGQVNAAEDDPLGVSVQSSTLAAVRASDAGATHRDPKSGEFAVISDSSYGNTADYHPIRGVIIEVEFLSHETALETVKLSNATGAAIKTKFAADVSTDIYNNINNQP